jgi:Fe-S cluster assembly protein SufD
MTQLATAQDRTIHVDLYARLAQESRGERAPWLDELRRAAMARFEQVGFPSKTQEEWRFTDISPITKTQFKLAERVPDSVATDVAASFSFGNEAASELVFVNGHFAPGLSRIGKLPRGVKVGRLSDAIKAEGDVVERHLARLADIEKNPFVALNTGFLSDGAFLHFARGTVVEQPIHLLFVSAKGADLSVSHPRVLVVAEDNVHATIVESYVGANGDHSAGVYFTNAVTEIVAGQGCHLDHCKLQQESLDANHVATMQVKLGRDATFVSHSVTIGARLTRNDLNCLMAGPGAYATLNGLVLVGGNQHCDNHTLLDHAEPNCPSHELYKHVLSGKSTAVFKGKILVRQPAQKTDSKQTSKTLLLSDDATMNSQPALEIYADDVKCTHGSTTGPVDEDMVFYLRSRGVGLEAAKHLLSYAFAADITRRIKVEPVRRRLEDFMATQHGLPQDLRITNLGAFDEAVQT